LHPAVNDARNDVAIPTQQTVPCYGCVLCPTSLQVAEGLQLRSRRRPPGFWDNEDALDRELGRFITSAWTQHNVDDDVNQTYFYNQVLVV
jgi:hypothetical protein